MELLITLLCIIGVVLYFVFRKQVDALIIKTKQNMDRKTDTSVKIQQTIKSLGKKQKQFKEVFKQVNVYVEKIKLQCEKENFIGIKYSSDVKATVKESIKSDCGAFEIKKGDVYVVKDFDSDISFVDIGLVRCWNKRLFDFDFGKENKHMKRYYSLEQLKIKYEDKAKKIEELIKKINMSIESLRTDLEYVHTIESIIDIEQYESNNLSVDIDVITAEIDAVEKQLEMEERLNGSYIPNTLDVTEEK